MFALCSLKEFEKAEDGDDGGHVDHGVGGDHGDVYGDDVGDEVDSKSSDLPSTPKRVCAVFIRLAVHYILCRLPLSIDESDCNAK